MPNFRSNQAALIVGDETGSLIILGIAEIVKIGIDIRILRQGSFHLVGEKVAENFELRGAIGRKAAVGNVHAAIALAGGNVHKLLIIRSPVGIAEDQLCGDGVGGVIPKREILGFSAPLPVVVTRQLDRDAVVPIPALVIRQCNVQRL